MKKFMSILFVLLLFGFIGLLAASFIIDDMTSKNIESTLNSISPPSGTTIEQSVSRTGKITTKNGAVQYYGAILLQSNQPYAVLKGYYEKANKPEQYDVTLISLSDAASYFGPNMPGELRFSHHDSAPDGYYIVYAFGEAQMPFPMFDFRSYF